MRWRLVYHSGPRLLVTLRPWRSYRRCYECIVQSWMCVRVLFTQMSAHFRILDTDLNCRNRMSLFNWLRQRWQLIFVCIYCQAPDSLRAKYGSTDPSTRYQTGKNLHNALHASNTPAAAKREIQIFFPSDVMEPLPTSESSREYLAEKVNPTLLKGLTALAKAKPADPLRCVCYYDRRLWLWWSLQVVVPFHCQKILMIYFSSIWDFDVLKSKRYNFWWFFLIWWDFNGSGLNQKGTSWNGRHDWLC